MGRLISIALFINLRNESEHERVYSQDETNEDALKW